MVEELQNSLVFQFEWLDFDEWHPTQMIADFITIQENFGTVEGITVKLTAEMVETIWLTLY